MQSPDDKLLAAPAFQQQGVELILRTLREPDAQMADAGDVDIWRAMVTAALDGHGDVPGTNPLAAAINIKANS